MTEKWKGPEPYGRGSSSTSTSFPSPPPGETGTQKNLQCSRVTESSWGVFVQFWLLCLGADEPHSSARVREQLSLQDLGLDVKGGVGKRSSGGSLTMQGQLKSSEVQKLALV